MRILIVTPAPPGSRAGNRITALRWGRLLREMGHHVAIAGVYTGQACHLLVALHAARSAPSILRYWRERPGDALVVALTGTDVYGAIHTSAEARQALEAASHLVVLQPLAALELAEHLREKVWVIYQSVRVPAHLPSRRRAVFDVAVVGHLRPVKDPFRTAEAARLLPPDSRVRVWHVGAALSPEMEARAREEMAANPRYRWLGERSRGGTMRLLARAHLLSLTSISEGGANVIGEAVSVGTPVVSSHIAGSVGLLGGMYEGYFPVGDTAALAALLLRAETDAAWLEKLRRRCEVLRPTFTPEGEAERWRLLLEEVTAPPR
jgi:putative glycosyltransferase (TIGR04348 family)